MAMVKPTHPKRFEVYWINLDPIIGAEVKKLGHASSSHPIA